MFDEEPVPANATLSFWHWDAPLTPSHEELDADGMAHVQIHGLVNPGLAVATLMENCFKDVAVVIGDASVLPVSGWLCCPYRVCGRCANNLALSLDLAYACA